MARTATGGTGHFAAVNDGKADRAEPEDRTARVLTPRTMTVIAVACNIRCMQHQQHTQQHTLQRSGRILGESSASYLLYASSVESSTDARRHAAPEQASNGQIRRGVDFGEGNVGTNDVLAEARTPHEVVQRLALHILRILGRAITHIHIRIGKVSHCTRER